MQTAYNQARYCGMTVFQSVAGSVKWGPVESNFVKTLINTHMNFSLHMRIYDSINLCWPQILSI